MNGHCPTLTFTQHALILQPAFKLWSFLMSHDCLISGKYHWTELRVCGHVKVHCCEEDAQLFLVICLGLLFFVFFKNLFVVLDCLVEQSIIELIYLIFNVFKTKSSSELHIQSHHTGSQRQKLFIIIKAAHHTVHSHWQGRGSWHFRHPSTKFHLFTELLSVPV